MEQAVKPVTVRTTPMIEAFAQASTEPPSSTQNHTQMRSAYSVEAGMGCPAGRWYGFPLGQRVGTYRDR
jgi:hypothetical protein